MTICRTFGLRPRVFTCKFAACICIYRYIYAVHIRQVTLKVKSKQNFKVYAIGLVLNKLYYRLVLDKLY
jgi:hypothetical protein